MIMSRREYGGVVWVVIMCDRYSTPLGIFALPKDREKGESGIRIVTFVKIFERIRGSLSARFWPRLYQGKSNTLSLIKLLARPKGVKTYQRGFPLTETTDNQRQSLL